MAVLAGVLILLGDAGSDDLWLGEAGRGLPLSIAFSGTLFKVGASAAVIALGFPFPGAGEGKVLYTPPRWNGEESGVGISLLTFAMLVMTFGGVSPDLPSAPF